MLVSEKLLTVLHMKMYQWNPSSYQLLEPQFAQTGKKNSRCWLVSENFPTVHMKKYWWITYLQHQGKREYLFGVKKLDWFCTLRFSACASCTEDIPNPFPLQQQQHTLLLLHCTQEAPQNIILSYPISQKKALHSSNPATTSSASLKPPCSSSSSSLRRKTRKKIKLPFLWRDLDDSKQLKIPGDRRKKSGKVYVYDLMRP